MGRSLGESSDYAKNLLAGDVGVDQWKPSENEYDWLGRGIYFWEHAPERARRWAGTEAMVIGAVIQLGNCLDLTDVGYTSLLGESYDQLEKSYKAQGLELPENTGPELKNRKLDCLVINDFAESISDSSTNIQTVRGAFEEGGEAFPGAALRKETHIQVAVRDPRCILGIFRPTFQSGK